MVKVTAKRKQRKEQEFKELEVHLTNEFFCGSCSIGIPTLEDYQSHCEEEEHEYHVERRIRSLVPGLGYCAACACLIQNTTGWDSHKVSKKHEKCINSQVAVGNTGPFDKPLGCQVIGEVGTPIEPSEISQKESVKYGYGHGGKLCKWSNLIGLSQVTELGNKGVSSQDVNYKCATCDKSFSFEHRGTHLTSLEHRMKYLEEKYPDWYADVLTINEDWFTRRNNRVNWYAYKIEGMEKEQESSDTQKLRKKFFQEATQKNFKNQEKPGSAPRRQSRGSLMGPRPPFRGTGGPRRPPMRPAISYGGGPGFPPSRGRSEAFLSRGGPRGSRGFYHSGEKRPLARSAGGYQVKKQREDPYAEAGYGDQLESNYDPYNEDFGGKYAEPRDEFSVLEELAMKKARESIKNKIYEMKNAVYSGHEVDPYQLLQFDTEEEILPPFTARPGRGLPSSTAPARGSRAWARGSGFGMASGMSRGMSGRGGRSRGGRGFGAREGPYGSQY